VTAIVGCAVTQDEVTEESQSALPTNCPADAKPCDCLLKGTIQCTDPDGDGILSLYDNCDFIKNANQADCDGDKIGDACDSLNAKVTYRWVTDSVTNRQLDNYACVESTRILHRQWETRVHKTKFERKAYCGPAGTAVVETPVEEDTDYYYCWKQDGGCANATYTVSFASPQCTF
jgi:hypothetical protein